MPERGIPTGRRRSLHRRRPLLLPGKVNVRVAVCRADTGAATAGHDTAGRPFGVLRRRVSGRGSCDTGDRRAGSGNGRGHVPAVGQAGALLLLGMLACFLYLPASMSPGAACNDLFLVCMALFSASLYPLPAVDSSAGRFRPGYAILVATGPARCRRRGGRRRHLRLPRSSGRPRSTRRATCAPAAPPAAPR